MNRKLNCFVKHMINRGILCILICIPMLFLPACSAGGAGREVFPENGKLNIVTTLFPYYDFVRSIAGDRVNLVLLIPAGMESHSFEPSPADMIAVEKADLVIYNGGAMEVWMDEVLSAVDHGSQMRLRMMDYVDVVEEEGVEGMQVEHDHENDGHFEEIEYDEHIWTSPVNAMKMTETIAGALAELDTENKAFYEENAAGYTAQLKELDMQFREVAAEGSRRMIVFADRFPLRYFADEYGLTYRAAFNGCSTDTEPSVETLTYLIDKVREDEIPAIYHIELSSTKIAEIISEETGAEPLLFHSCHNVTKEEEQQGVTYLSLMKQNVEHLKEGLR